MSEPLLTIDEFTEMFGEIDTPSKESQLRRPLGVALRRIKSWVGEAVYTAAVAADDEDECRSDLQFAAGYLAMHFLIANFNTVVRSGGIVKSEKAEGNTILSYLTPDETKTRAQEFFDLADEAARPWKAEADTPSLETITNETEDYECRPAYVKRTCS